MNNIQTHSIEIGGRTLTIETGRLAKQAAGACLVRMGDTSMLVTAVLGKEPKKDCDFLPLTCDYRERTYAAGRIPGGFFKREGRPRENEILKSRLIDRGIRPLFSEGWYIDTQVVSMVMSYDGENDSDIPSIIGASLALLLSEAPFTTPLSAVRICRIDGKLVINPTIPQQKLSDLSLVVSGTKDAILMVEAGANEVSEADMVTALNLAHQEIKRICDFQLQFKGKEKAPVATVVIDPALKNEIETGCAAKVAEIVTIHEKKAREFAWDTYKKETVTRLAERFPESEKNVKGLLEDMFYRAARTLILDKRVRSDGRKLDEIRPIECGTGILPRTHGSALFTRGQTQALASVTLGTPDDMQIMDELGGEYKERFLLHYNFPGFATGEAKADRGTSRREMGHGALARRALMPLLPAVEEFAYTIRIVSDILESNGSSSMASVCGGSLALFDAGVPAKAACAGIAMGLVKEGDKYAILSDIMGMEDHLGDMDFKVAGTRKGITALQMDMKVAGLTTEVLSQAMEQARAGRMHILGLMEAALAAPRAELSTFAPRMVIVTIPKSKIGELIGPGGKNIRRIQEESGAEVNIEEEGQFGKVYISSTNKDSVDYAVQQVSSLTADAEVGKTYKGKVTRLMNFGAFVEIMPGKEGLVHISQLAEAHVKKVEDVVKEGDEIMVKVVEIDAQNRINLSHKAVLLENRNKK